MRAAANLVIAAVLLLIFNAMDWLTISNHGSRVDLDHLTWPAFGSVMVIAVILWVVGFVIGLLWGISILLTLGLALFAFPFIGGLMLKLTASFMPGTLSLHGFWLTVLCGFLLLIVKIPSEKREEKSYSTVRY